jgi:phenylpyruvate tautomerase PptA (4-oxalocrotonate tautomerase family)
MSSDIVSHGCTPATADESVAPLTIHRKEAIMPLVYVTLAEGTTSQDRRAQIGDAIHRALIEVANAPEDDRFQVINEVPLANLIYSPDFMDSTVVRQSCSFRSSSTGTGSRPWPARPADPSTSSGHCMPGSPKIWARPEFVATTFSSTSSKCPRRTGRSGEVNSAIHPPRLRARDGGGQPGRRVCSVTEQ